MVLASKELFGIAWALCALTMILSQINVASAATYTITKTQSGLLTSDPLNDGNTNPWTAGGTATIRDHYEDSSGLHIGVRSPQNGDWVNRYAYKYEPNAYLFHSQVQIHDATVPDGVSNVGLYVEGSDFVPHVGCEAYADWSGHYWVVEQSGDAGQTYDILYITQPNELPQTQDCTIMTNGDNYLKVYIGGNLVFSSTSMDLGMSGPLIAYFQNDASSSSAMRYATYRNYYATSGETITVTGNPSTAKTVKVLDSTQQVLASSSVVGGTATLDVGKYNFPISGTIVLYDANNSVIASNAASIYGGDVYSVTTSSGPPSSPLNLLANAASSSQINLSWNPPTDNGGLPISGYKIERSVSGSLFSVLVANTGSTATTYSNTGLASGTTYAYRVYAINSAGTSPPSNAASATTPAISVPSSPTGLTATAISSSQINLSWNVPASNGGSAITGYKIERSSNGGSTWLTLVTNTGSTTTTYSNTGLSPSTTYQYRVSAVNSEGTSPPSSVVSATTFSTTPITATIRINSEDLFRQPFDGMWVELWQNGEIIQEGPTPFSATINTATQYEIFMGDWQTTIFDHWGDGNTTNPRPISVTQDTTFVAVFRTNTTPPNNPPSATNDSATTTMNTEITINVLANDSDPNNDPLAVTSTSLPANGSATLNADNTVTYLPNSGFAGTDAFTYMISDGRGGTDTATVSILVRGTPTSPTSLSANATSSTQIILTWNAPINNGGSPIAGYQIERSTDGNIWEIIVANTGTTNTTYSDTALVPSTAYSYRVSAINSVGVGVPSSVSSAITHPQPPAPIRLLSSGLIAFDPLNNETQTRQQLEAEQGFWHYNGSAYTHFRPQVAPTDLFKNSEGIHLGTQSLKNGTYAGFYAVTSLPAQTSLFHAVITTPLRTISELGTFFQNGLYVQTWDGRINYVTCVSITSTSGTTWHIIRTLGDLDHATSFEVLWSDLSANQSLTKDCTIITNGNNYLKVYLDGTNVYTNSTLDLQMPGPYLYFLEPQNPGMQMYYGIYKDFYATKDETIKITDVPVFASRVDVTDLSGNVLSSASVVNGTATADVGMYHFPLAANITVYDAGNNVVATTSDTINIYGGDVYSAD